MKNQCFMALCAVSLSIGTVCGAVAQEPAMPAVPITVEVHVRDPDGLPVKGATVHLALPRYRLGDKDHHAETSTDESGIATVSGIAQQDYQVGVDKVGYYHTTGPHRGINTPKGFQQYAVGVQRMDLELRPIRNPIRSITKFVNRMQLPAFAKPVGFDLEMGDWVAPYGKGRMADFIFKLEGRFSAPRDYDQTFTLTFSQPQDGILLVKYPVRTGSAFKFPYEAPLTGYESRCLWRLRWNGAEGSVGTTFDLTGETNYIFRVRSEVDEAGNVVRAWYGVVSGDFIPVGGNQDLGRNISFTYALNPDGTRNLEFDPEKTAASPR